ncbi:hypothetical protein M758_11G061600 [Ceratodon purpureus]|nr:hypothetical protein M758_11G061600 [Ceratodon purpureus]
MKNSRRWPSLTWKSGGLSSWELGGEKEGLQLSGLSLLQQSTCTLDSAKHNKLILKHTPTHKHTVLKALFHSPLPISLSLCNHCCYSLLFSSLPFSSLCMCNPTALPPGAFLLLLLFCIYSGGRMFGTGEKRGPWWL